MDDEELRRLARENDEDIADLGEAVLHLIEGHNRFLELHERQTDIYDREFKILYRGFASSWKNSKSLELPIRWEKLSWLSCKSFKSNSWPCRRCLEASWPGP